MSNNSNNSGLLGSLRIRGPQNFVAGVILVSLCAFVFWAVDNLDLGTLEMMGPAMFPRGLAMIIGLGGAILLADSFMRDGDAVGHIALRGPFFVVAGIVLFALTIRTFGLAIAGTASLAFSGFATPEARPREVIIFAVIVTAVCILLFRYALGMVIPVFVVPGTSIEF